MIFVAENKEENKLVEQLAKKQGGTAYLREDSYAITRWSVDDVLHSQPALSREAAEKFLEDHESKLVESSVSGGWDFIDYADYLEYKAAGQARTVEQLIEENIARDQMTEEEEKAFVEYWYDKYEETGFTETFSSPYSGYEKCQGQLFEVVGRCQVDDEHDLEALPMWRIRFGDGVETEAFPEEICVLERNVSLEDRIKSSTPAGKGIGDNKPFETER